MAFTSEYIRMTLRYEYLGQKLQTARTYRAEGIILLLVTAGQLGEAYWNAIKSDWRAWAPANAANIFKSILVEEAGGSLGYGEYPIPTLEQGGTRDVTTLGQPLPSFCAVGCRLSVETRDTRPGQMRIPFLYEGDSSGQQWGGVAVALVEGVAETMSSVLSLGAPAATVVMHPQVWRGEDITVPPTVTQDVIGYVLNSNITTQNSRKWGRGQ